MVRAADWFLAPGACRLLFSLPLSRPNCFQIVERALPCISTVYYLSASSSDLVRVSAHSEKGRRAECMVHPSPAPFLSLPAGVDGCGGAPLRAPAGQGWGGRGGPSGGLAGRLAGALAQPHPARGTPAARAARPTPLLHHRPQPGLSAMAMGSRSSAPVHRDLFAAWRLLFNSLYYQRRLQCLKARRKSLARLHVCCTFTRSGNSLLLPVALPTTSLQPECVPASLRFGFILCSFFLRFIL